MNISCPHCGTEYEVGKQDIGRFVTCESCGNGFVAGARPVNKSNAEAKPTPAQPSRCQSSGIIALWICIFILVMNLAMLVVLCVRMHNNSHELSMEVAKVRKSIDEMNEKTNDVLEEKMNDVLERMVQMDESRHHDAEQIYDRIGRMKLY